MIVRYLDNNRIETWTECHHLSCLGQIGSVGEYSKEVNAYIVELVTGLIGRSFVDEHPRVGDYLYEGWRYSPGKVGENLHRVQFTAPAIEVLSGVLADA